MRVLKIFLILFMLFFVSNQCSFANDISVDYNNGIYHIVLKGEKIKKKIRFISSEDLITNNEAHKRAGARLTVNAGYFDPKNGKTISYVVTDRSTSADPLFNPALLGNNFFKRHSAQILNRSEFRVLQCGNKYKYDITSHNSGIPFECALVTSAQAGPLVYPALKMEEEAFIVKDDEGNVIRESASVLHKTSRTVIGIKGKDECHILIITDENPMDLYDVQKLCKELNLDRAMAFDGGSSTSMNYKKDIEVISIKGDGAGRMLKSFMVVY